MSSALELGLEGRFTVVTGSTAGIGRAIAEKFARAGATVVINGRSQKSVDEAIAAIVARTGVAPERFVGVPGDLSTADGCNAFIAAVDAAAAAAGRPGVEVLVNNFGVFAVQDFFDTPDDQWLRYHESNVMSGVRLTRRWLKDMIARNDHSRVIFISSECGARGLPTMVAYAASKSTQMSITRSLAELTKGTTVTVNAVLPGPTMTEGVKEYLEGYARAKNLPDAATAEREYFSANETSSLVQRFGEPEEVANVVLFVASRAGSLINGAAQRAEGGIVRTVF